MKYVYCLMHSYDNAAQEPEDKILGYYHSREEAKNTIDLYNDLPGFREHPDGFIVGKIEIGRRWWVDGFVTILHNDPI